MTTTTALDFARLLSTRAKIGYQPGMGVRSNRMVANPLFDFGAGRPDPGTFPYDGLVDATARMMKEEGDQALTYGDPLGYVGLRDLVVHKYDLFEGLKIERDNVIIANGSGAALALAFSAFVDVGDAIITEAPTFSGTLAAIRRHGARVLDAPVDAEGIDTAVVRRHLETLRREGTPCKLIYTIVNFQNPAGPTQSLRRRKELVALAQEFGTIILEDDAYGELRFEGEQLPSLYALDDAGCVIRSGTLSKILGAGVRLGWLAAPKEMIPVLQGFNFGGGVNPFMSRVAVYFMRDNLKPHVELLAKTYHQKRDAMLRGLWEVLGGTDVEISKPDGGFFIWIKLPTGTDPKKLAQLAAEQGIQYAQGPGFFPNGGGEQNIRLAYSYETVEKCYEGSKLVGQVIKQARA